MVGFPPYYTENIKDLYNSIRTAKLQMPKYISKDAKDLLNQLLNKRPDKRITLDKVKQHEFFKGLDWDKLSRKELSPPVHLKNEEAEELKGDEYMFLKQNDAKFNDKDYTE